MTHLQKFNVLLLIFICTNVSAQTPVIDSLKRFINNSANDSNKVNALIELSNAYRNTSKDTALKYAHDANHLAAKIPFPKGLGYALKAEGLVYNSEANYVDALRIWQEGLKVFEDHNLKAGAANLLNNIGTIYYNKSNEDSAQFYYLRSLEFAQEIKDTLRIATALVNLGGVYSQKPSTYEKSLEYHKRSLELSKKIGDKVLIGSGYANIGELLLNQNKPDSALRYLFEAQKLYEGTEELPYTLNVIGNVYKVKRDYQRSIEYHSRAYDSASVYHVKLDMAQALLGIADAYKESGNYDASIKDYERAQLLFEEIGLNESYDLKLVYEGLSDCYMQKKNYQKAMDYHIKLLEVKDKIYNIEVDKKLSTKLFAYEIEKKQSEINRQQSAISRQKLVRNGLMGGMGIVLLFAGVFLLQRNRIGKEKKRSDALLLNILPAETAEELKQTGSAKAKEFEMVTVMFTDFKNFTLMSEKLNAQELVNEIHYCYSAFDKIMNKYGIEKIKTIGDSYMCAAGLPVKNEHHAIDIMKAAIEVRNFIEDEKRKRIKEDKPYFEIRIGLNSGSVVAGIVGTNKFAYDIWGDAVNIASRMESSGEPGKINISGATYDIVKDQYKCTYRGKIQAKNKGAIDMYFVEEG